MAEFLANLDPAIGSEQGKTRPVVVISDEDLNQILPVVNVLPLTGYKTGRRIYPNEVLVSAQQAGLAQDPLVLCYQIRTLDKARLIRRLGQIQDQALQQKIFEALFFQLGVEENPSSVTGT